MTKIVVTTDSGVSPIVRNKDLIIPACLNSNTGETYKDLTISNKEILDRLDNGEIIKTSSPLYNDYYKVFKEQIENGNEIIHLSMSSGISSGSVEMSNLVSRLVDEKRIDVIDTYQGATGGTLINEVANNLVSKKLNRKDIVKILEELKSRVTTSFLVPDPRGFIRSGRDNSEVKKIDRLKLTYAAMKIARNYNFIVKFDNGNLYNDGNYKTKENILKPLLDSYLNNIEEYDPNYIVIGSVFEDKVNMKYISQYIEKYCYFKNIIIKEFPGVVAAYGCKDLCGISLVKKKS